MRNMLTYSVFGVAFESIIEDEVEFVCSLAAFVPATHEMAIHKHDASVVKLKPDYDCALVACTTAKPSLDLSCLQFFNSA